MMYWTIAAPFRMVATAAVIGLGCVATANAGDVEHYEGEPSKTLEQAVKNFTDYNAKLAGVLDQDSLTMADIQQVHEYTYTLEQAVAKMRAELADLAVTLEEVHQASEGEDAAPLRVVTQRYLDEAAPLE